MKLIDAETLALLHMEEHGVLGTFIFGGFEKCKSTLGRCHYKPVKKITLSEWYVFHNDESDVEDTILHEIAHALDYMERGRSAHDRNWRKWCLRVGANPQRCGKSDLIRPDNHYKYVDKCCGKTYRRHRMSLNRMYYCPSCKGSLYTKYRKVA